MYLSFKLDNCHFAESESGRVSSLPEQIKIDLMTTGNSGNVYLIHVQGNVGHLVYSTIPVPTVLLTSAVEFLHGKDNINLSPDYFVKGNSIKEMIVNLENGQYDTSAGRHFIK